MSVVRFNPRIDYAAKTRLCSKCGVWKSWDEFTPNKVRIAPHPRCKQCSVEIHREKRRKNPTLYARAMRNRDLKRLYGIDLADYERMLEKQGFCCKLCKSKKSGNKSGVFCVDHCHTSGVVRGLLCCRCNVGLANWDEDIDRMLLAIQYIHTQGTL